MCIRDRSQPLPDDGDELFGSPEVTAPKSLEYEVLKMKLQLRQLQIEADKEARKAEREDQIRKIEAERETRKMELEMELKKIELTARTQVKMVSQVTLMRRGPQQLQGIIP